MRDQLEPGWLARGLASAEREVATWPDWKREAADADDIFAIPCETDTALPPGQFVATTRQHGLLALRVCPTAPVETDTKTDIGTGGGAGSAPSRPARHGGLFATPRAFRNTSRVGVNGLDPRLFAP